MAKWQYLQWGLYKFSQRCIRTGYRQLYRDNNRETQRSMMVAGTARSGTTWLADLISLQTSCRIIFEPFNSRQVPEFDQFHYFQYMRPKEENDRLLSFCQSVLTGNIRHPWIDRHPGPIFPTCRLIKDIRGNLFLRWLHDRFPEVPLLFVIRHPCAVVLSRMQLGWATDTDIASFLSQQTLIDDFLSDKIDLISRVKTVEEKHAIIWCISNIVPLVQFHDKKLNIIFYENLCYQPEVEIPKIFKSIKYPYNETIFEYVQRPSLTSKRFSAILSGNNKLSKWKDELSHRQVRNILNIIEAFKLEDIYNDSEFPLLK